MNVLNQIGQIRDCIAHIDGLILCLYCNRFSSNIKRIAGCCRKIAQLRLCLSFNRIGSGCLRCNDTSSHALDRHLAGGSIHYSHIRIAARVCNLSVRFSVIVFSFSPVRIDCKLLISVYLRYMISIKGQYLRNFCRCGNLCCNLIIIVVDCSCHLDCNHSSCLIPLYFIFKLKL